MSIDHALLEGYLVRTRWFAGKGRPFRVTDVRALAELHGDAGGPEVTVCIVTVQYADAEGGVELYQVPVAAYDDIEDRDGHPYIGSVEVDGADRHLYDAVHDREAMALWLAGFIAAEGDGAAAGDGLRFRRVQGGPALDPALKPSPLTGEQSNSSVRFEDTAIMKLFRKVSGGINPDIEIHEKLTRDGSEHIAELYGWVDAELDGQLLQLAMLQEFLRTAADGFELATGSVRTVMADPTQSVAESGGDFAGEATRLGEALAEIHATLRAGFPCERRGASAVAELSRTMIDRLDQAQRAVPELEPYAHQLRAVYRRVADLDGLDVQRVHGDLHLGQTLRTAHGWRIVDFEGEPGRPFRERALPDSPWRDVAGMLRSFDYASRVVQLSPAASAGIDDDEATLRAERAEQWSQRAREHFLRAYVWAQEADAASVEAQPDGTAGAPAPEFRTLLDAYEADKAVYEAVYEKRNRPSWIGIPLAAIARIAAH